MGGSSSSSVCSLDMGNEVSPVSSDVIPPVGRRPRMRRSALDLNSAVFVSDIVPLVRVQGSPRNLPGSGGSKSAAEAAARPEYRNIDAEFLDFDDMLAKGRASGSSAEPDLKPSKSSTPSGSDFHRWLQHLAQHPGGLRKERLDQLEAFDFADICNKMPNTRRKRTTFEENYQWLRSCPYHVYAQTKHGATGLAPCFGQRGFDECLGKPWYQQLGNWVFRQLEDGGRTVEGEGLMEEQRSLLGSLGGWMWRKDAYALESQREKLRKFEEQAAGYRAFVAKHGRKPDSNLGKMEVQEKRRAAERKKHDSGDLPESFEQALKQEIKLKNWVDKQKRDHKAGTLGGDFVDILKELKIIS